MFDSLRPHGLQPTRLLCPCDFPGKSTGVGCHFLLQGIFLTQGSNPGLPHCSQMLLPSEPLGKSCPTLCDPVDCSIPGFPVLHHLPKPAQTHVHWVSDAIQPSCPLLSPSAFNLSQHRGLFQWVNSSHQVAKLLELQLQHQSCQLIFRTNFFEDGLLGSACSSKDSQESSPTPQFKSINSLALSFLYSTIITSIHGYWKNHSFD